MSSDIKTILIASDKEKLSHQSVMALVIIFLASLIDGLDASIVTVALPKMSGYFGTSISDSSWFIFAYVVGLAAFLLPLGKMAKNNRVRKFMILGTALFGFSSFMCGISEMFWMLVAFRLLQGVSAAMMSCVLPSMVVHMLPADRKGLGMSVMGASTGIALILGPVLGGLITTYTTWHWLFFINIPICLIIIFLSTKNIPKDDEPDREKDPTVIGGISAMILIGSLLTMMEDLGDPDINTIGRIVCGILVAISLPVLIWSIRKDRNRAIIAPKVIYNKEYLLVGASFLLCTIVVAGAQYLLPYVLQGYWGMSPMESSLYLSTISVAMVITVTPVGRMCDSIGCKFPAAMAVTLRSMFCIAMIIIAAAEADAFFLIPALIVFGMSHAFSGTAQPTRMIHHSTPGYEDESTNLMLMINYLASALGCVLFAVIFSMTTNADPVSPGRLLLDGFTATMWFSLILLAMAMVCTLAVKNKIVKKE